jgi:hypothetical protein
VYNTVRLGEATNLLEDRAIRYIDVTQGYNVTPATEETLEQLNRLLHSRVLHGSESLRAFLKFVVLKSVENNESQLKEYTIATEVFGSPNYDSRSDSTVRVQAGRLRAKLQEYYATEGKDDRVIIDLPKGQYHPHFSYAEGAKAENGSESRVDSGPLGHPPPTEVNPTGSDRRIRFLLGVVAALCLLLGALAISNGVALSRLKESGKKGGETDSDVLAAWPLWSDFLRSTDPILVSFSNTRFEGTAETGMRILKPMVTHPAEADFIQDQESPRVITEHYTGVGEVMGVYAMGEFFHEAGHSMRLKRSLLLTWDDIKNNDIVVLGSPAENYLLRELPQPQDFVFRMTKDTNDISSFGVINTKPKAGEQSIYLAKQEGPSRSQISEDYAVISLLQGLDQNHRLLILAGITTFGTQAAAEYVTKPEHIKELISKLNIAPPGQSPRLPPYFQMLVKVKVNGGVPVQISYVTHHVL